MMWRVFMWSMCSSEPNYFAVLVQYSYQVSAVRLNSSRYMRNWLWLGERLIVIAEQDCMIIHHTHYPLPYSCQRTAKKMFNTWINCLEKCIQFGHVPETGAISVARAKIHDGQRSTGTLDYVTVSLSSWKVVDVEQSIWRGESRLGWNIRKNVKSLKRYFSLF